MMMTTPIHATQMPRPRTRIWPTMRIYRDPRGYYEELFAKHGDPFRVDALNGRCVITCTPEGAKEVFKAPPSTYGPFAVETLSAITGPQSLLLLDGKAHREERKLMRPAFHGERMRLYASIMRSAADKHFGALAPGESFVAQDITTAITLEVIARVILGDDHPEEVAELMEAIESVMAAVHPAVLFSKRLHVAPLGLGPWAKFMAERDRLDALLNKVIRRRRTSGVLGEDLLSMFLAARYEDGSAMTDEHLKSELVTMFVAGHETTSVSLAWALYHVYFDDRVKAKLRHELGAGPQDAAERARLPYLDAVGKEALRLHPIVPDILRTLHEPIVLRGVEVPAGYCVAVAITTIHHDPEIYPEPDTFRPERFIDAKPSAFEYLPFGGGHRRCIGAAMASYEMAQVLDVVVSDFELVLQEPAPVAEVRRNVTMGPATGVRMKMLGRRAG